LVADRIGAGGGVFRAPRGRGGHRTIGGSRRAWSSLQLREWRVPVHGTRRGLSRAARLRVGFASYAIGGSCEWCAGYPPVANCSGCDSDAESGIGCELGHHPAANRPRWVSDPKSEGGSAQTPFAPMTSDDQPERLGAVLGQPECNDLEFVVAAWPQLPMHIRATIRTLLVAVLEHESEGR